MPLVTPGTTVGGVTSPLTTPAPLVFSPADKDAVAIQLKPVAGATNDQTDQLEWYNDAGVLLGIIDAAGNVAVGLTASSSFTVSTGTTILMEIELAGGVPMMKLGLPGIPASSQLGASEFALWLDDTPGATKLMIKAKDSGSTVRTASVALA